MTCSETTPRVPRTSRRGEWLEACAAEPSRGASLLTMMVFTVIGAAIAWFTVDRGLKMMQLTQSTSQISDLAVLERSLADNMSCTATLGPAGTCPPNVTLRGTGGTVLTNSAGQLGGYTLNAKCVAGTPGDPNKRLVIMATISRDPLRPEAGSVTKQLFKRGNTYTAYYPCIKYLNMGPRYKVVVIPPSAFARSDYSCNKSSPPLGDWGHSKAIMTCPAGYVAAAGSTVCTYTNGSKQYGSTLSAYTGGGSGDTGRGGAFTLTMGQAFVDCCAPPPAAVTPNPGYLTCVRN